MQRKAHEAQQGKSTPVRRSCQADGCQERLSKCKAYCARCRVCPTHLAAQWVTVKGVASRFCQLCAKFHVIEEFDGCRRSCRIKLARHNESKKQRRKEAAQQQQTDRTLATSHQVRPRHKTNKQHIDSSSEYDLSLYSVPASGSSFQRPPIAGSASSEDEGLLSRIIRLSGCRVSMNLQQWPRQGAGPTYDSKSAADGIQGSGHMRLAAAAATKEQQQ